MKLPDYTPFYAIDRVTDGPHGWASTTSDPFHSYGDAELHLESLTKKGYKMLRIVRFDIENGRLTTRKVVKTWKRPRKKG